MEPPIKRTKFLRYAALAGGALFALAGVYAVYPRAADLGNFDPAAMALAETAMWRDYYEKRYAALFAELYTVARKQQGYSPLDSMRIAFAAARAAHRFQPSRSRAEANAALPDLVAYYTLLAAGAPGRVDVHAAAATELDWWQARREHVGPEAYGLSIARVTSLLYGVDNGKIRRAGVLRAQAMAYRDAHGNDMQEKDWREIEFRLGASYRLLKRAIAGKAR